MVRSNDQRYDFQTTSEHSCLHSLPECLCPTNSRCKMPLVPGLECDCHISDMVHWWWSSTHHSVFQWGGIRALPVADVELSDISWKTYQTARAVWLAFFFQSFNIFQAVPRWLFRPYQTKSNALRHLKSVKVCQSAIWLGFLWGSIKFQWVWLVTFCDIMWHLVTGVGSIPGRNSISSPMPCPTKTVTMCPLAFSDQRPMSSLFSKSFVGVDFAVLSFYPILLVCLFYWNRFETGWRLDN
jgi:hypothetical protein